ncbi:hypothetical protein [Parvularcula sp. LCG005]|uniref:hypothetical protein n=1 Tax=Parvularcula sp. LCG005 TaxID=3078805 RepID=UPI0029438B6A|nr:hypothetical protein [Parvularcula sp. LCG005]WOI52037.1 hypothetical protein RUI03_07690 [Parvularcula sp. LCG005]
MVFASRGSRSSTDTKVEPSSIARALRQAPRDNVKGTDPCLDGMVEAIETLSVVVSTLSDLRAQLGKMAETSIAASAEPDLGLRALMAEDFDDLRDQYDRLLADMPDPVKGLLTAPGEPIRVALKTGGQYFIAPFIANPGEIGLNVAPPNGAFASHREVATTLRSLDDAFAKVDEAIQTFKKDRAFIKQRIDRLQLHPKD